MIALLSAVILWLSGVVWAAIIFVCDDIESGGNQNGRIYSE